MPYLIFWFVWCLAGLAAFIVTHPQMAALPGPLVAWLLIGLWGTGAIAFVLRRDRKRAAAARTAPSSRKA